MKSSMFMLLVLSSAVLSAYVSNKDSRKLMSTRSQFRSQTKEDPQGKSCNQICKDAGKTGQELQHCLQACWNGVGECGDRLGRKGGGSCDVEACEEEFLKN
eukprot:gnl/MRDRNA2_/MRDRNA2_35370_c0_seq1.p1 gnl/MRDRNA2_/MRDRNA2_35370_c0~~gnl/MRDRNA2_/MRDRNA2_35370_c0_seq1.p1  ORF type:complete len:101 (+),score=14.89 gnl/MRDRNA2_/MRDRNA2_35370_c0_seq1:116-418(+)